MLHGGGLAMEPFNWDHKGPWLLLLLVAVIILAYALA